MSQGELSPVPEMTPAQAAGTEANPHPQETASCVLDHFLESVLASAVALACHSQDLTDPSAMGSDQAPVLTPHFPAGVADLPVFDPQRLRAEW